jgi:hypothetical protein
MKKSMVMFGMVLLVIGVFFVESALAGRITRREHKQQARITQGVASGQLTFGETHRLQHEQWRIEKHRRIAWSDGHLTPYERIRLENEQDRASRRIYRFKHNGLAR